MNFDEYWQRLVDRVHHHHETLRGKEEVFYRLSCIIGETFVDGMEAYFERRFEQFDADMDALCAAGFSDVASDFRSASLLMFGESPLTKNNVEKVVQTLLDETAEARPILHEIERIYRRVIPRLGAVADYRDRFGQSAGFYTEGEC